MRDVAAFAKARGFTPIIGAYHWQVRRYGKRDAGLIYERVRALAVFKELLGTDLIPAGYFRTYLKDNIRWLRDEKLDPCDAGRYSVAIDASGNVSPCLALGHRGNLRNQSLSAILAAMDRTEIKECSNNSTCNLLCSRIIGSSLRHPINSLLTIWQPYRTVRQCAPSVLNNP